MEDGGGEEEKWSIASFLSLFKKWISIVICYEHLSRYCLLEENNSKPDVSKQGLERQPISPALVTRPSARAGVSCPALPLLLLLCFLSQPRAGGLLAALRSDLCVCVCAATSQISTNLLSCLHVQIL